jgi:hypothetical protein
MPGPGQQTKSRKLKKLKDAEEKRTKKVATVAATQNKNMSKLAPSLKALIKAPFARPGQAPAPRHIRDVYTRIAREARERQYGDRPWVTLSVSPSPLNPPYPIPPTNQPTTNAQPANHTKQTKKAAATFTLNSPASLQILHSLAPTSHPPPTSYALLREVGLKCISFNGIPRTINCLGALKTAFADAPWQSQLPTAPSRALTPHNLPAAAARGRALWKSVYAPFDDKLEAKLAESHPDLPVVILGGHYAPLWADPPPLSSSEGGEGDGLGRVGVGRTMTSVVAIACLRAQTGVGPQVLSHVFGLRKGVEQGAHWGEFDGEGGEEEAKAVERLAGDEGCEWLLRSVDAIAEAIGAGGEGGFANWEGRESKL